MYERLTTCVIPNNAMDINVVMPDAYTIRGNIQQQEFVYNYGCDIVPRFIGYRATIGEIQFLKKMLDTYLASDTGRQNIAELLFI